MTIEEVRQFKNELEENISTLLIDFVNNTSVHIDNIEFT